MNGRTARELRQQRYVRRRGRYGPGDWIEHVATINGGFCPTCDDLIGPQVVTVRRERTLMRIPAQIDGEPERVDDLRALAGLIVAAYDHEHEEELARGVRRPEVRWWALSAAMGLEYPQRYLGLHSVFHVAVEADRRPRHMHATLLGYAHAMWDWYMGEEGRAYREVAHIARVADRFPEPYANYGRLRGDLA